MAYHGPNQGSRRTFTREEFEHARAAWAAGDFSSEWQPWRHLAAMRAGLIFPPQGTKWDSWGDDEPSERALLIRAIREQPQRLREILETERVGAWSNVVALLTRGRDELADSAERQEREWLARKVGPMTPARSILQTIMDSLERDERRAS